MIEKEYDFTQPIGSTIVMSESNLHGLILVAGRVAYDRCSKGQSWEKTQKELIDALVAVTRPMTDRENEVLLGK